MKSIQIGVPIELPLSELPPGISILRHEHDIIMLSEEQRNWPIYVVSAASSFAISVLANYLYDTIKHAAHKEPKAIMIEEEKVDFQRGEIESVLRRRIMIQE